MLFKFYFPLLSANNSLKSKFFCPFHSSACEQCHPSHSNRFCCWARIKAEEGGIEPSCSSSTINAWNASDSHCWDATNSSRNASVSRCVLCFWHFFSVQSNGELQLPFCRCCIFAKICQVSQNLTFEIGQLLGLFFLIFALCPRPEFTSDQSFFQRFVIFFCHGICHEFLFSGGF